MGGNSATAGVADAMAGASGSESWAARPDAEGFRVREGAADGRFMALR